MTGDGMDPEILNITPDFGEKIEVPKLAVQIMFDALCHSMDFGSGFLDTEEVEALRAVATILGIDPMAATPRDFVTRYQHAFTDYKVVDWRTKEERWVGRCKFCSMPEEHKCHIVEQTNIKLNAIQGVALGAAAGIIMWAGIVGAALAVLS